MKQLLTFLFLTIIVFSSKAQDEKREATHTFDPQQCHSIRINIPSDHISTKEWGKGHIKMQVTVKGNMPVEIMQLLERHNRYQPTARVEGDVFVIELPNVKKSVVVKGRPLQEELFVKVFSPVDLSVYEDTSSLQLLREFGGRSGEDDSIKEIRHEVKVDLSLLSSVQGNTSKILDHLNDGDITIDGQPIEISTAAN